MSAQYKGTNGTLYNLEMKLYPDNTPVMTGPRKNEVAVKTLYLRPASLQEFVAGMFWTDAYYAHGGESIDLILPLVPGVRQDRLNSEGDYLFTLKSVADMINARNFINVYILDPHSDVAPALINSVRVAHAADVIKEYRTKFSDCPTYDGVIAPDAGAAHRAQRVADYLELPLIQAWKNRNPKTNKLSGFGCPALPIYGGRYLIVDDLCDAGGTFVGLADTIKWQQTVTLDLYVSHGLFTKGFEELDKRFDRIYTTDSVSSNRSIKTRTITVHYNGDF